MVGLQGLAGTACCPRASARRTSCCCRLIATPKTTSETSRRRVATVSCTTRLVSPLPHPHRRFNAHKLIHCISCTFASRACSARLLTRVAARAASRSQHDHVVLSRGHSCHARSADVLSCVRGQKHCRLAHTHFLAIALACRARTTCERVASSRPHIMSPRCIAHTLRRLTAPEPRSTRSSTLKPLPNPCLRTRAHGQLMVLL